MAWSANQAGEKEAKGAMLSEMSIVSNYPPFIFNKGNQLTGRGGANSPYYRLLKDMVGHHTKDEIILGWKKKAIILNLLLFLNCIKLL